MAMAERPAQPRDHPPYGGQAVIEGVMMRGTDICAVAVRKELGRIVTTVRPIDSLITRHPRLNKPVLRGLIALYDTIRLGIWAIQWSAEVLLDKPASPWTSVLAGAVALLLFVFLPERAAAATGPWLKADWQLSTLEGLVRVALFALYFFAISRLRDVQRIFRYHGAEHRTINAFEAGVPLEVGRVQQFASVHDRCGTNFVMVVLVVTLVVFAVLPWGTFAERILLRLLLLPLLAGASYELVRLAARRADLKPVRWVVLPGLWLQRLTTGTPDDEQVEVAIRAFEALRSAEAARQAAPAGASEEAAASTG